MVLPASLSHLIPVTASVGHHVFTAAEIREFVPVANGRVEISDEEMDLIIKEHLIGAADQEMYQAKAASRESGN
jgi:GGDEF domain-containing protein